MTSTASSRLASRLGKWNLSSYILSKGPRLQDPNKHILPSNKYHLPNQVIKVQFLGGLPTDYSTCNQKIIFRMYLLWSRYMTVRLHKFATSLAITVGKRNYCMPYGILLHAFPAMSYILLMKYQVEYTNPASQHSWLLQTRTRKPKWKLKRPPSRRGLITIFLWLYISNLHVVNIVQYGMFACINSVYWLCHGQNHKASAYSQFLRSVISSNNQQTFLALCMLCLHIQNHLV